MSIFRKFLLCFALLLLAQVSHGAATYVAGKIVNVSFVGAEIFIMVDAGLPDNCAGTPYGWMVIPVAAKATSAFVIGLRLSDGLSQTTVYVYTSGRDASGYCQINQIDPVD